MTVQKKMGRKVEKSFEDRLKISADSALDSDTDSALACSDSAPAVSNQPRAGASVRTSP
jgi:hypothetical protein